MIDDFADRILVLRNLSQVGGSSQAAQGFQDELSKHHASSALRQKLPEADRFPFITVGESTPSDHAGVTVKQQGHIRFTTVTMPIPTGFWGCEKLVDLEQIEILGLDNQPLAAVLVDTMDDKVTLYEKGFSEPVAQLSHFDDDEKKTYDVPDSWHGWNANYPGFAYQDSDPQFPARATLDIGKDKAVLTMSTPADHSQAIHRTTFYIDHDRISHWTEWKVDSPMPGYR